MLGACFKSDESSSPARVCIVLLYMHVLVHGYCSCELRNLGVLLNGVDR